MVDKNDDGLLIAQHAQGKSTIQCFCALTRPTGMG